MVEDNLDTRCEDDMIINYDVVSMLPVAYDHVSEVFAPEEDFVNDKVANENPLCYYVISNGVVEEQIYIFEKLDPGIMYHLKPLFIQEKMNNVTVNKVFLDESVIFNLIPHSLFRKMEKSDVDHQPYNMVLSNYEGKTNNILGVIQVELSVGTTTRPTLFMVIALNANYSLLLGVNGSMVLALFHQLFTRELLYGVKTASPKKLNLTRAIIRFM